MTDDRSRVAFITGGARGIGRTFADALVADGHRVVLADASVPDAEIAAAELGADRALAAYCDVADEDSVRAAVDATVDRFGGIDILINNAGRHLMSWSRPVTDVTTEAWRDILDVNVLGIVNCARACRPHLRAAGDGAILSVSSVSGFTSTDVYGVTKLAVRGLTVALAKAFADDGIRVNCLAPGPMDTAAALADLPDELLTEFIENKQLIRRQGRTADLVGAMRFFCSPESSFVTGETLIVGGGFPLRV
ncbi:SDR family NAD(P)-dependent oxidoreductase [Solwaraspora sp. WMMD1047]|uniref:SDR family NAD(P)-dependent oxidoreductase n=1 Tax=Solwaraspora sp. WMMD1047 TaxID=3016102 RepID=UPI00241639D5|nr:SDR family oxidoreductase [Solwaraspora sp. WMMD1047]MDG4834383.1 SDR family NAD(P)-dependent oxidoreductase [Solwaraspora sp. WMMD1047]